MRARPRASSARNDTPADEGSARTCAAPIRLLDPGRLFRMARKTRHPGYRRCPCGTSGPLGITACSRLPCISPPIRGVT